MGRIAQTLARRGIIGKPQRLSATLTGNKHRSARHMIALGILGATVIEHTPIGETARVAAQIFGQIIRAKTIIAISKHACAVTFRKQAAITLQIVQSMNYAGIR